VTDQLLSLLSLYGTPALFLILAIASAGLPLPVVLLLVAAGSFVEQGEMKLWQVLTFGVAGAVAGDQVGYWIGRKGGPELVEWITKKMGGVGAIEKAEALNRRWGGAAVFFTRWLVTPLGSWINLTSGTSGYRWHRFLFWDCAGQALWVVMYVTLGRVFSDRVEELAQILGNVTWVLVGILAMLFLGWKVVGYFRKPRVAAA
jgi:membrane-associated protein